MSRVSGSTSRISPSFIARPTSRVRPAASLAGPAAPTISDHGGSHADPAPAQAGGVDPGHCPTCARQAGLLDHYDRVQRDETRLRQTRAWAWAARRYAIWALCSSGGSILLAVVA